MKPNETPELLAPAGNLSCALAAFDAGADAVYAGLARFNARERGENFALDEFLSLVNYAHVIGRKVYLTLNTLVKEDELDEAAELLAALQASPPDAVLVQDLGVARMIRECFPAFEMHASTQMGIHNPEGLKVAAELGFKRVVLERQLTLEEVALCAKDSPVELEVFVHGALCCSLSGQCLFSSWSGAYSGNRGKCKQPCRRRFFSKQGNGFFFSTADLCSLEMLDELKAIGVASLKIEGRLRQADYVAATVEAYRLMLDAESNRKTLGEARRILSTGCGRKWSEGFYSAESMKNLIQYKNLGASGVPCGQVSAVAENGFSFTAKCRVHLGDRVRLQPETGDEGPAMTITKMFVNNAASTVASAGDHCFVCCDKPIEPRSLVYRIGHAAPEPPRREMPPVKRLLNVRLSFGADGFRGELLNAPAPVVFERKMELAPAEKRALAAGQLEKEFALRGDPAFASGRIESVIDGSYFLPLSELKKLKIAFWEYVLAELEKHPLPLPGVEELSNYRQWRERQVRRTPAEASARETVAVVPRATYGNPKARVAASIYSYTKKAEELILPDFCAPSRIPQLARLIDEAVAGGVSRFRISGLYAVGLLKKHSGAVLVSGYGIPVCNSLAAMELSTLGVTQVMAHVELEKPALEKLIAASVLPVELYRFGRVPLLSTRAAISVDGQITDARGARYMVEYDRACGLTRLYSTHVMSIPKLPGTADFYDLTHAHWGAKEVRDFNFSTELV
ncbi:MAG: U32 family peptidase [Victivallaceae bacterium]|nr:U32 family peptidase [Victivallaceae bacterium]